MSCFGIPFLRHEFGSPALSITFLAKLKSVKGNKKDIINFTFCLFVFIYGPISSVSRTLPTKLKCFSNEIYGLVPVCNQKLFLTRSDIYI